MGKNKGWLVMMAFVAVLLAVGCVPGSAGTNGQPGQAVTDVAALPTPEATPIVTESYFGLEIETEQLDGTLLSAGTHVTDLAVLKESAQIGGMGCRLQWLKMGMIQIM